ncbi:hypothetical protein Bbelb_100730 [Branchiostoma belcheri]|nr:hypothetical protein Bbelb_100730 [Branchiostoma belcheri]
MASSREENFCDAGRCGRRRGVSVCWRLRADPAEHGEGVPEYFFFIKENVSSDWKDLAFHLGFEQADITNIGRRNRDDKSSCMDLLWEWLKRNGDGATIEVLIGALTKANLKSTVDGLKKEFSELKQCLVYTDQPTETADAYGTNNDKVTALTQAVGQSCVIADGSEGQWVLVGPVDHHGLIERPPSKGYRGAKLNWAELMIYSPEGSPPKSRRTSHQAEAH